MKEADRQMKAKLFGAGLHKSKNKGTPAVILRVKTKDLAEFDWTGWLTPDNKEKVTDKLIEFGFVGQTILDVMDFPKAFPQPPLLDITIEDDGYEDNSGQWVTKWKVKWIDLLGKGGGAGGNQMLDKETAIREFSGMNFGADLIQARQRASGGNTKMGGTSNNYGRENYNQANNTQNNQRNFTADDIPF